jgi:biotin carboxyl carrier protein
MTPTPGSGTRLFRDAGGEYSVSVAGDGTVRVGAEAPLAVRHTGNGLVKVGDDPSRRAWAAVDGDLRWVFVDGEVFCFESVRKGARRRSGTHLGTLSAPMPATVISVPVSAGDPVKRGDTLIILEAMKMELPIRAPADGTVARVNCRPGELVQPGAALLELE